MASTLTLSHQADLSQPALTEVFLVARSATFKMNSLRQQGEAELKQAAKERDFFKAGEIRKEAESKISEARNLAQHSARDFQKISESFRTFPGWKTVRDFLASDTASSLVLENCAIDVFVLNELIDLGNFCKLHFLYLAGNDISDLGAFLLAENLSKSRLEAIDLRNCGLGTDGCVRLIQAVLAASSLKRLDLRFNGLLDVKPVTEAINAVVKIKCDIEILF
jgi:hypothetical protein